MIVCPECGHDGSAEGKFSSGGGWNVSHSFDGQTQTEEWTCPICKTAVYHDEKGTERI